MGVFDEVKCLMPLPWPEVQDVWFQTKSPDAPYLEKWEIREDATLWKRVVERKWEDDPTSPLGAYHREASHRWVQQEWQGEFEFYHLTDDRQWWYTVKAWFKGGKVVDAICEKTKGATHADHS